MTRVGLPLRALLLPLLCCAQAATGDAKAGDVLLWAPPWSRRPPRVALRGSAIGSSTSQGPFAVWENFAEIPRAVELFSPSGGSGRSSSSTSGGAPSAFFADTQGSLYLLEPGEAVHELLPRDPTAGVDTSILSLAYDKHGQQLYYTRNATLNVMKLSADGSKPDGDVSSLYT